MTRITPPTPRHLSRAVAAVAWLVAAGATIAVLLLAASAAEGGTYRATQCNPAAGASRGDFSFHRSSGHYTSAADCAGGGGLVVRHDAPRTKRSKWGAWRLEAPSGATVSALRARVGGSSAAGHVPELLIGLPGKPPKLLGRTAGSVRTRSWRGGAAESLEARLRCARASCGEGAGARALVRRVNLRLADDADPSATIAGALAQRVTRRGVHALETAVADSGAGVRRVFVEVNNKPVAARRLACHLVRRVATRLQPCPAAAEPTFSLDTERRGFHQGVNRIRICADDFALRGLRNRSCERRLVRVDNECPVDSAGNAGRLRARIAGAGRRATVARGRPVRVVGRLADSSGRPIGGAEVCVAARVSTRGAVERVLATPRTDADGSFSARLGPGANREVRVAHWAGSERVSERHLVLRVRARPRLRVSPGRTLRNGERVRFGVRLHGPRAGGKRVRIEVRSGGRWVLLFARGADSRGHWSGSYRFRNTTGTRTYRFRAVVPRQMRYPYERGTSATRRVRVSG